MIDEIFEHLYSKMITEEWISLNDLAEMVRDLGLSQDESDVILSFLKKYFLEVDESARRVRLNPWVSTLFKKSSSH